MKENIHFENLELNSSLMKLMEENKKMKSLLSSLLPDLMARVQGLREVWPAREILTALHRNEEFVKKIRKVLE